MPKLNKWELRHLQDLSALEKRVEQVFDAAIKEAAKIATTIGVFDPSKPFSFSDYPITRQRLEKLLSGLKSGLSSVIVNGIDSAWTLSNNKNNELARQVFGDNVGKLSQEQYRRYFSTNDEAREAFKTRKENGLNLSDRVWRYTNQFKDEIEQGLDVGLRNGISAPEMSRELRQWLKYPEMRFRRRRDENGDLKLSTNAAQFHPGQGVYRSSYKNARRLAATETNIAYRTADYTRWQDFDFVVGIKIVLSNNHTCLGSDGKPHKFEDICDRLSAPLGSTNREGKGCYPKSFKFTGWHPHCRCHVETILKTEEEMAEDNRRILNGEEPTKESKNEVKAPPAEFSQWLDDNKERAKRSYSVPYFLSDNKGFLPHEYLNLYSMKKPYDTYAEYEAAMKFNKRNAKFTPEQRLNNKELSEALPVIQGKVMNFKEADRGKANPNFTLPNAKDLGYHHNCQTCTMTFELRRRGFDVEAEANPVVKGFKNYRSFQQFCASNKIDWQDRFLTSDGKRAEYAWSRSLTGDTVKEKLSFIEAQTTKQGRYEIYCAWKKGNAHVFILERQKNGELLWFDPQSARRGGCFEDSLDKMIKNKIGIMRIDDKIINPKFASRFLKSKS